MENSFRDRLTSISTFWVRVYGALLLSLVAAACGGVAESDLGHSAERLGPATVTLSISLPGQMRPEDVGVAATVSLKLADRSQVREGSSGYATVISTGTTTTSLVWPQGRASFGVTRL
jgi:hypothetical protein